MVHFRNTDKYAHGDLVKPS